ncbi:MAG: serine/threonine-protein kinase [Bryobacteraceae bacterium]
MPPLEQIETLFHQALLIEGVTERRQWLTDQCGDDAGLLAEVESLLEANQAMASDGGATPAAEAPAIPKEQFGPYRAVRFLGRGGMSAVYLAERTDGRFDRRVAIKVMAAHLAGDDFRHRFETEGQFLAALRHPNITNLLDGGLSSGGHPYLAIEYVEGEALDAYCDHHRLSIDARLRLFLQVTDAVEYAHRNLILHRDLKPGNILVNQEAQVKLLDFGTASLLGGGPNVTATLARMLTPRYASPEQLRGERPGVAGDVFSLGVVLYELLTGAWPFGNPDSVVSELQRVAADVSPTRPAAAVTQAAAEQRSISCDRLRRLLGGDLSAVMLKTLENEPARRYSTVSEFATDLKHYLEGRPVGARPQTAFYRLGKFVRRRWFAVAATAVFIVAIAAASIVAVLEARTARAEALKSEQVNQFLTEMLTSNGVDRGDLDRYTVEQMLEAADRRLEKAQDTAKRGTLPKQTAGGPVTLAILHLRLAQGYLSQQRFDKVQFHLNRSIPVFRAAGDEEDLARALAIQAWSETAQGHYQEAARCYQDSLASLGRMTRSAHAAGVFDVKRQYARLLSLMMHGPAAEIDALYADLLATGARDQSIPRVEVASVIGDHSLLLLNQGKTAEAEAATLQALAMGRKEDPGGMWEQNPLFTLTVIYGITKNYQAGKEAAQRAIDNWVHNFGPEAVGAAQAREVWATFAVKTGDAEGAAEAIRQSMPLIEKRIPSPSLDLWHAARNASNVMRLAGDYQEAERYARESLMVVEAAHLAEGDPRAGNSWEALGLALYEEKKYAEAIPALEKAVAAYSHAGPTWAARVTEIRQLLAAPRK